MLNVVSGLICAFSAIFCAYTAGRVRWGLDGKSVLLLSLSVMCMAFVVFNALAYAGAFK